MRGNGFVKLRRGIAEHVEKGLLSAELFGAYTYIILNADHKTGIWIGSGLRLAAAFSVCWTKGKRWLAELHRKGYLDCAWARPWRGDYPIRVLRYRPTKKQAELFGDDEAAHAASKSRPQTLSEAAHAASKEREEVNTEEKNKTRAANTAAITSPLPDWLPAETWEAYREMRRKIRRPMTAHAEALAVRRLGELRAAGHEPTAVLEQSILNSWQGLFPTGGRWERDRPAPAPISEARIGLGPTAVRVKPEYLQRHTVH